MNPLGALLRRSVACLVFALPCASHAQLALFYWSFVNGFQDYPRGEHPAQALTAGSALLFFLSGMPWPFSTMPQPLAWRWAMARWRRTGCCAAGSKVSKHPAAAWAAGTARAQPPYATEHTPVAGSAMLACVFQREVFS